MIVYLAMAVDLPTWALKSIDKIRRGFLWRGRKDVKGGLCLITWPKVTRPPELGGLGITNLQQLGWALRARWLWLKKTEPDKPWAFLPIPEKCPLCDQEEETINHLLLSCVFVRLTRFEILQGFGLQVLAPKLEDPSFEDWWHKVNDKVSGQVQKGLNSIIILMAW